MQELELTVERLIWRGRGLARLESGQVVILEPGVFPGERILAEATKITRDHIQARCTRILEQAEYRFEHPCPLGDLCGGCRFGVLPYQVQVHEKHRVLHAEIRRALGRKWSRQAPDAIQVFSSPENWGYRWRGQTEVMHGRPHVKSLGSQENLHCPSCLLHAAPLARTLPGICRDLSPGRYIVAASPLDHRVLPHTSREWLELPLKNFEVSLLVRPGSFFQANWRLNQDLVKYVHTRLAHLENVADLYAGAGNFALACAAGGHKVLALESDTGAAKGAMLAAKRGGAAKYTHPHRGSAQYGGHAGCAEIFPSVPDPGSAQKRCRQKPAVSGRDGQPAAPGMDLLRCGQHLPRPQAFYGGRLAYT